MRTLPVHIDEDQISEMFHVADKDGDGKLGFEVRFIIIQCNASIINQCVQEYIYH